MRCADAMTHQDLCIQSHCSCQFNFMAIDFNLLLIKDEERKYRYQERLGFLCEDREPTPEEKKLAMDWSIPQF